MDKWGLKINIKKKRRASYSAGELVRMMSDKELENRQDVVPDVTARAMATNCRLHISGWESGKKNKSLRKWCNTGVCCPAGLYNHHLWNFQGSGRQSHGQAHLLLTLVLLRAELGLTDLENSFQTNIYVILLLHHTNFLPRGIALFIPAIGIE